MRAAAWLACALAAATAAACNPCAKGRAAGAPAGSAAAATPSSASPTNDAPSASAAPEAVKPGVKGDWAGKPFLARSAVADVYPQWVTITIYNRSLTCASTALRADDMALQVTIPSGPAGEFFATKELSAPLHLSGAGGVSEIPAGDASVRIDEVHVGNGSVVRGHVSAKFVTGTDDGAPRYEMDGPFDAMICSAQPTIPSMESVDRSAPLGGQVGGKRLSFPTVLAYTRDGADGRPVLVFKAYTRGVECHAVDRATPFLFGAEVGAGPSGDYHAGTLMPASWVMQMNDGHSGERSVHAGEGAGLIQIDAAETRTGGVVRGSLAAMTSGEADGGLTFSVAGTFVAKVCGQELRAW